MLLKRLMAADYRFSSDTADLALGAIGASVTVFDPDLDADGRYARLVRDVVVAGLGRLGTERLREGRP
jgi:hypothetical protein